MPVESILCVDENLFVEFWYGLVTHDELMQHEATQFEDVDVPEDADILVDARDAQFETTLHQLQELIDLYDKAALPPVARCALLVHNNFWDRSKLYEQILAQFGVTAITFTSLDVACQWLGRDPAGVDEFLQGIRRR